MKLLGSLLICLISTTNIISQIIVEETYFNLGEIGVDDKKYHDFKITNASDKTITIENIDLPYGVTIRLKNESVKPDSSTVIRIKYTPKRKGEFSADIPVKFSSNNEPIVLTLNGKATSYDIDEDMTVPAFEKKVVSQDKNTLLIKVVNKETGDVISDAKVDIIWDGVIYESLYSNNQGMISKTLKQDNYYFLANAPGYHSAEKDFEITGEGSMLIIELGEAGGEIIAQVDTTKEEPEKVPAQALQDEIITEPDTIVLDTTELYVAKADEALQPVKDIIITPEPKAEPEPEIEPEPEPEPKIVITSEDLPEDKYAPNNIVFLIDVSVSMRSQGKLDLLKASMIQLANLLRATDKVAIVTYSSSTNVVLQSTAISDKNKIIEVIKSLEAGGKTAGTKGIKRAYKVLNNNYIHNGNNQIFISTDGAFNLERKDKKLLKIVKRNAKKGSKISVIGIKNKRWTVPNMQEIARSGYGSYLHIDSYEHAKSSLIEEVKKQSIKD